MKKLFLTIAVLSFSLGSIFAGTGKYKVDDASIDQLIENAVEVDLSSSQYDNAYTGIFNSGSTIAPKGDSPIVAWLICWFLGSLGIHRLYMGTKTLTVVGYILTAGGCGIVSFIDWIMLLIGVINNDIRKYVNNPKYFMW